MFWRVFHRKSSRSSTLQTRCSQKKRWETRSWSSSSSLKICWHTRSENPWTELKMYRCQLSHRFAKSGSSVCVNSAASLLRHVLMECASGTSVGPTGSSFFFLSSANIFTCVYLTAWSQRRGGETRTRGETVSGGIQERCGCRQSTDKILKTMQI